VYLGDQANKFYAFNRSDGTVEWSYTTGGKVSGTAVVANDVVYVSSYDDKIYAFDFDGFSDGNDGWDGEANTGATDGDIIWNYTLGGDVWSTAAIVNGVLYIADLSNKLWALGQPSVDIVPPQVTSTDPANAAVGVALDKTIAATFNEALDPSSVTAANFTLKDSQNGPVTGTVAHVAGQNRMTFDPAADLLPHETYTASVIGIKDTIGNAMTST
jgi:hypothetical protein